MFCVLPSPSLFLPLRPSFCCRSWAIIAKILFTSRPLSKVVDQPNVGLVTGTSGLKVFHPTRAGPARSRVDKTPFRTYRVFQQFNRLPGWPRRAQPNCVYTVDKIKTETNFYRALCRRAQQCLTPTNIARFLCLPKRESHREHTQQSSYFENFTGQFSGE